MTVECKQLGDEPIVIATIFEPVNMAVDPQANRDFSNEVARQFDGPVYRITDFTNFEVTFSQLVLGLAEDIKSSEPNIKHVFVGSGEMVELQTRAGSQEQYGAHEIQLFESVDEAIAFAREQLEPA